MDTALSRFALLCVEHFVPGMAVERLLQPLLVQCMADQANGPRQHKETVQIANLDNVLDLNLQKRGQPLCPPLAPKILERVLPMTILSCMSAQSHRAPGTIDNNRYSALNMLSMTLSPS